MSDFFADGQRLPRALDTASLVEKLEHVPFVRLVPRYLHRRSGADGQPLDVREIHKLVYEGRVFCNRRYSERVSDLLEHLTLGNLNNARIRTEEFLVRQRVIEGVA